MHGNDRPSSARVLGLDIGGAHLKAATASGAARTVPFALWREPGKLPERLRELLQFFPAERIAATMTGELCDCFATKREGVCAILDALHEAAPDLPVHIWSTHGRFLQAPEALVDPWSVAAANWHALATYAGHLAPAGAALVIDIGSTTTDIIPLWDGKPASRGRTDPERLAAGELVYTGARRTPLCALLGAGVAAELFATMHDAYLMLETAPEQPDNRDTADGRPATRQAAHGRLARMMCSDVERFSSEDATALARRAHDVQMRLLCERLHQVCAGMPKRPRTIVVSGSGAFLARRVLERARLNVAELVWLEECLSPVVSEAACAYALAVLGEESPT
jgi:(4-(4-[2-(gamma-L-glutamylamino)ethyl]phenoxymethyl)furan-2-yl)methanamine synthase